MDVTVCGGITQRSWLLSVSPEFAALVKEWTAAHRRDGSPPSPHQPDSMLTPFPTPHCNLPPTPPTDPGQNPLQALLPFNLSLTAVSTKWNAAVKSAVLRRPSPSSRPTPQFNNLTCFLYKLFTFLFMYRYETLLQLKLVLWSICRYLQRAFPSTSWPHHLSNLLVLLFSSLCRRHRTPPPHPSICFPSITLSPR